MGSIHYGAGTLEGRSLVPPRQIEGRDNPTVILRTEALDMRHYALSQPRGPYNPDPEGRTEKPTFPVRNIGVVYSRSSPGAYIENSGR